MVNQWLCMFGDLLLIFFMSTDFLNLTLSKYRKVCIQIEPDILCVWAGSRLSADNTKYRKL